MNIKNEGGYARLGVRIVLLLVRGDQWRSLSIVALAVELGVRQQTLCPSTSFSEVARGREREIGRDSEIEKGRRANGLRSLFRYLRSG